MCFWCFGDVVLFVDLVELDFDVLGFFGFLVGCCDVDDVIVGEGLFDKGSYVIDFGIEFIVWC